MSAFEKAYLRQQQSKESKGGSAGGYQDLGGGNTVWRQAQPGMFTLQGQKGKSGFGQLAGTVGGFFIGGPAGAALGSKIGGGVDSYMYS